MGVNEFWAWVDQVWRESEQERAKADSWEGADSDPRWQAMRAKRERKRGR